MSEKPHIPVHHANLQWREDGQPVSSAFDDIYFSSASGLEETRYVFLAQNNLTERWTALENNGVFTIGETGFGTGLNFLAAWQLWQATAPASAHLHFVSVEKFPLRRDDLARALTLWPELAEFSTQLLRQYPAYLATGVHRLNFGDKVHLTLIIDEASSGFQRLLLDDPPRDRAIDAWFLDGFAPAKNPDMWSEALFRTIADLSTERATFATFTCAGIVKRGLKGVGFALEKVPGFGHKREMLRGSFSASLSEADHSEHAHKTTPWHLPEYTPKRAGNIAVVGAGIAGACAARALAERGFDVTVFEQGDAPGSGASGNDQGILYAKLSPKPGPNGDFNLLALQFAQRYYPALCPQAVHFDGLLQLAQTDKERQLQQQIVQHLCLQKDSELAQPVTDDEASALAGVPLAMPGLYFPQAGWLQPKRVCTTLLQHPNIHIRFTSKVHSARKKDGQWHLGVEKNQSVQEPGTEQQAYDALILCSANFNCDFEQTTPLPLQPIRGQVSFARATAQSSQLNIALCGEGYIAPAHEGDQGQQHSFGATFKLKQTDTAIREDEHQENLTTLATLLPEISQSFAAQKLGGRAALRAATPDYLPMAGPVADWEGLEQTYSALRKNRKQLIDRRAPYQHNLYVLAGLGSRGFTYAPLAAEVIAAWISGEVIPVSEDLVKALHPMRFAIRNLGKNKPLQQEGKEPGRTPGHEARTPDCSN
ncbi:bifunctional tRNA (5-methylaminomethyl-2-thiouridine)(34)-methyltransferase MnmD/FAD-dependent 5-carboxymethylaminomethyl-2-thiouridine(34) oxidoreductase MnmC [Microbulbifer bruguierae]|uniref:tRNA 5-methylaminomethyl-2-thiouridine biosynthesis bifunctional protein MnmC n=1 Tax=Microbulbifer bruguierae TaxID=3029061 RepID=A0ABY8NIC5_9GAMM|nr:bifunctional tRNA (5-methylaminomethyl-2-thiouridine)(34)-methyltransferase MnmD/FAD-dependent 5-carboxymethylaminomethyl-2-thiouridine(34) oxidoreductase MnmC [Microbulbifer bruguierae]WGL17477.1 bifunctional tRNA (5-methylaminomethyl-2-thiouridine)(34)-methyltransferase MnmD/FAD-dependent 5-carboxymethylaminomethyl-2-thiouridine(34) oxidoreductase MnmC [Microbulbifer bruguierae]